MNWKEEYRKKVSKPAEAIKAIRDGQCVVMGHAAAAPHLIQQALADHCQDYNDVLIYHMTTLGDNPCYHPCCFGHFRHVSNFLAANSRTVIERREGDFFPAYFKDVPSMIGSDIPCDVAVFQATPPNAEGYCSLGVSCDYARAAIHAAKTVIVETNEMMPFTYGDTLIHVSQIDHIIPCAYRLQELQLPEPGEVELAIGRHCASLVADGSTLQLGIGAIPDAVLLSLTDKNDLGIHSEMFSNGVIPLVGKGIINGRRKTLHRGKVVVTFIMGTRELYDFVDENPDVEFVQIIINYFDWESYFIQPKACYDVIRKHGKQVVIMEAVKGGGLAKLPDEAEKVLKAVHQDWSIASWSMRFCLDLDDVITVLSGMSTLDQVKDNIATSDAAEKLTDEDRKALDEAMRIYRESAPIKQSEIDQYKGLLYHGVPVSAILQAYSICQMQPDPGFSDDNNYLKNAIAEAEHVDFSAGLEKQEVVTKDGRNITEMVEMAVAWLTEHTF